MTSKNKIINLLVVLLVVLVVIIAITKKEENGGQVACTMEAKICPDGSAVGRIGPKCEFAPCPTESSTENWETFKDQAKNISFKYPKEIGTTYITTVDWPPTVSLSNDPFSCNVAGKETDRAGKTENKVIGGEAYCVTRVSEGAAGSTYTQYAYTSAKEGRAVTFTFSLKSVQCANFDDPKQAECETERETFDVDNLVYRIGQTFGPYSTAFKPQPAVVSGTYLCLPHTNTTGPQTDECAIGLKTDTGLYYSLDLSRISLMAPGPNSGDRITIKGTYTPIEQLSSTWWKKYPIKGILTVTELTK